MRNILKSIYYWIGGLVNTIISFISILLFSSFSCSRSVSKQRKNNMNDVHILANGPSLKLMLDEHLDFLINNDCLVVNFFGINPIFMQLKPKYYVLLDPGFFGGEIPKELKDRVPVLMDALTNKVDWKMTLFIPGTERVQKIVSKKINNPNINIVPFNSTRVIGFKFFRNWAYKHNLGIPSSINVLLPSIQLMLNKGYQNVFLYGAEFSWTKTYSVNPENGDIYTDDVHFYDNTRIPLKKGQFKFDLSCLVEALDATDIYADYAEYIGARVINRTPGSFIDAFTYENPKYIEFR